MLVVDNFRTATSEAADVIIPGGAFIEQRGTVTSCDTMIQQVEPVINNADRLQNWEVIARLADRFSDGFTYGSYTEVLDELIAINRLYVACKPGEYWNKAPMNKAFLSSKKDTGFQIYDAGLDLFIQEKHGFHHSDKYYKDMIHRLLSV